MRRGSGRGTLVGMRRLAAALALTLALPALAETGPSGAEKVVTLTPERLAGAAASSTVLVGPQIVVGDRTLSSVPPITSIEEIQAADGSRILRISPPEAAAAVAAQMPGTTIIAVEAPKPAAPDPNLSPETAEWLEHCRVLAERRIARGGEIGGIGALGMRLGSKGQAGEMGEVDPAVAKSVEQWNEQGALILRVVPGSPADIAGLDAGDVVVQYGGIWIDTSDTMIRIASRSDVGREVEILYLRQGSVERTWIAPIDRKDMEALQP